MYIGEMMDANELVYLRARYYHPGLGVFTSLDPVEGVNRYQYVGGNVVNLRDPSGLQSDCCVQRCLDGFYHTYSETIVDCYLECLAGNMPSCPPVEETEIRVGGFVPRISPEIRAAVALAEPGGCNSSSVTQRSSCALQVFDAATERFGVPDSSGRKRLKWETFVSLAIYSEGGTLYNKNLKNSCFDNEGKPITCDVFRTAFENQIVRNLRGWCRGDLALAELRQNPNKFGMVPEAFRAEFTSSPSCSGGELLFWIAGIPGTGVDDRVSGIEALYSAANPTTSPWYTYTGSVDTYNDCGGGLTQPQDDARCGPVNYSRLVGSNVEGTDITWENLDFVGKAISAINRTSDYCLGCTWGNVDTAPYGTFYYADLTNVGSNTGYGVYAQLRDPVSTVSD